MKKEKQIAIEEGLNDLEWERIEWEKSRILSDAVAEVRSVTTFLLNDEMAETKEILTERLGAINERSSVREIIELTYQVNNEAKEDFYHESDFYYLKDILLDMAVLKCHEGELPENHWGYNYDERGGIVFYFDLLGVGQVSFHRPYFDLYNYDFEVPLYPYKWVGPRPPSSDLKEDSIHPLDILVSARGSENPDLDRNTGLRMLNHPKFNDFRTALAYFHEKRRHLSPELIDLAVDRAA